MKTALLIGVLICFAVAPAFANDSFDMFITDSNGGLTNLTGHVFQEAESPWLYIHSPYAGLQVEASWWNDMVGHSYFVSSNIGTTQNVWLAPDWSTTPKTEGEWTVYGTYFGSNGQEQVGTAKFSFAPEPVSASLFLLGGLGLAVARRKRA